MILTMLTPLYKTSDFPSILSLEAHVQMTHLWIWFNINQVLHKLIASMPPWVHTVIKAKGEVTYHIIRCSEIHVKILKILFFSQIDVNNTIWNENCCTKLEKNAKIPAFSLVPLDFWSLLYLWGEYTPRYSKQLSNQMSPIESLWIKLTILIAIAAHILAAYK